MEGTCHCGKTRWKLDHAPSSAKACNCTACRRYGVLWAYGCIDDDAHVTGETTAYIRDDEGSLEFHFCASCGCLTHWLATAPGADGRKRAAVNLRLAEPNLVEDLPVVRFDGLGTFRDLPSDGRTVKDLWF